MQPAEAMRISSRARLGRDSGGLIAGLAACLVAVATHAADPIELEADRLTYEQDGKILAADGAVWLKWRDNELRAGNVRFERESLRLLGAGGLSLDMPDVTIEADSCELLLGEETGLLRDVSARMKHGDGRFGGAIVRKRRGARYSLEEGYFTTCAVDEEHEPDWEISADKLELDLEGYGNVKGGVFRVRGVPVLYVPYVVFPTRQRRHSGLLLPEIAVSNERGFVYQQPFFWAIDKHSDLTLIADIETDQRAGAAADYRYRLRRDIGGMLGLMYFNDTLRDFTNADIVSPIYRLPPGQTLPDNRAAIQGWHRQKLTEDLELYADVLATTDDMILREVDVLLGDYFERAVNRSRRYTDSRMGLVRQRAFASYGLDGVFYQNLTGPPRDVDGTVTSGIPDDETGSHELTLQRPVRGWAVRDGDIGPLAYTAEASLDAFAREEGADGQRVDLIGRLERALLTRRGLRSQAWVSGRATGYRADSENLLDSAGTFVERVDDEKGRGVLDLGVDAKTGLKRTYTLDGSERFAALGHTLEPFVAFRVTNASDQSALPLYDDLDRIDDRSVATYGVVSRFSLTPRDEEPVSEVARLSVAHSYNVNEQVLDDHFSDVDLAGVIVPMRNVSLGGLSSYNVGAGSLQGAAAAVSIARFALPMAEAKRSRFDAVYRFVRKEAVLTEEEGIETLEGRTVLALSSTISIGLNGRYDFIGETAVEKGGGILFQSECRCWSIDVGVLDSVNPDELQFRIRFELAGLAGLGSSALSYDTPGLAVFDRGLAGAYRNGW